MSVLRPGVVYACLLLFFFTGCREVGFRELPEAEQGASREEARELLGRIRKGLIEYKSRYGTFPVISEEYLYDSIRTLLDQPLESEYLYRNNSGRGYYLAVGGRTNRIVYHFPGTVGTGEYTLYWVGPNGVDERGEGDDLAGWEPNGVPRQFERRKRADLRADGSEFLLRLRKSGSDLYNDTVLFTIEEHDSVVYEESWPMHAYFDARPELTEEDRKRIVRDELEKFFGESQFVRTDSILEHDWLTWKDLDPQSIEAQEIIRMNGLMFNYYTGSRGSRGLVWSPTRKRLIRAWHSGTIAADQLATSKKRARK